MSEAQRERITTTAAPLQRSYRGVAISQKYQIIKNLKHLHFAATFYRTHYMQGCKYRMGLGFFPTSFLFFFLHIRTFLGLVVQDTCFTHESVIPSLLILVRRDDLYMKQVPLPPSQFPIPPFQKLCYMFLMLINNVTFEFHLSKLS